MKPQSPPPENASLPILDRYRQVVLVVFSLALIAGVLALLWQRPRPTSITIVPPAPTLTPSITPIPSLTATPGPYAVYVTGAVAMPDMVIMVEFGSRVQDALAAVGGPLAEADLERVNLAQRLTDGDQVHVPTRAAASAAREAIELRLITPTPGFITVYVVGEVQQPGAVIALAAGSRVEDAITLTGGATDNADLARVNLSQRLSDGDYIYVPPIIGDLLVTPTPNHPPVVYVNSATAEELAALPGIGPALAQAIVEFRAQHGPFDTLDALDAVPGLGPAKLEAIRDQVAFD